MHFFAVISGKKLAAAAGIVAGICVTAHAAFAAVSDISASAAKRELPIYSVERQEKVCSLTFDAAWGSDFMRKHGAYRTGLLIPYAAWHIMNGAGQSA